MKRERWPTATHMLSTVDIIYAAQRNNVARKCVLVVTRCFDMHALSFTVQ